MAKSTAVQIPGFRAPWTGGAKAYFEADTFEAAKAGFKRKRNNVIFHMPNTGEAGEMPCAACGILLKDEYPANAHTPSLTFMKADNTSTWHYDAQNKRIVGGMHYGCSWGHLFSRIVALREI